METKRKSAKVVVSLLALAGLLVFSLFAVGGSLQPSAPPGPTMKTLDEVEPRIPIPSAAGRDPASTFIISESGSYYLTGDRSCSGTGIEVIANNVTIDLMGYSLIGAGSGTNYGISMNGRSNVEIRNGTVRNFYFGIYEYNSTTGQNHRVIDVRSVSNGLYGIALKGTGHLIKDCTASDNGTGATSIVYGIYAGHGCTVIGNTAYNNGTSATGTHVHGIYNNTGCTVTGNTAYYNGTSATSIVFGIFLSGSCLVDQNTAYNNNGINMNNPGSGAFGINYAP